MSRTKKSARKQTGKKRDRDQGEPHDAPEAKRPTLSRPATATATATTTAQADYDASVALKDPSLLSDEFSKAVRKHNAHRTLLELDDLYIPTKAFRDTTDCLEPHIATELPKFLEKYTEGGKEELSQCEELATPHTIVFASSGIRAADLVRELRIYQTAESKVGKFFAKHMKLKDNKAFLQRFRVGFVVGTPNRLKELVEQDDLKVDGLKRIVIDASYRDEKKRNIFDMAEVFNPMLAFLNNSSIKSQYDAGPDRNKVEILVF